MANNASGQRSRADVYCLKREMTGGGGSATFDPPSSLLRRFAGQPVPVRPASQCRIGDDSEGGRVYDVATGRTGLMLTIGQIDCPLIGACTVAGGYYEANLSSSGNSYKVQMQDGRWVVAEDQMQWIS